MRLGTNSLFYAAAAKGIHALNPEYFSDHTFTPKTFLLGGFHGKNGTPIDFYALSLSINPHMGNTLIYQDKSYYPFQYIPDQITSQPNIHRVQGNLVDLPYKPESIDYIVLDYTTTFMDDTTLKQFGERAADVLTNTGILLVTTRTKKSSLDIYAARLEQGYKPVTQHARELIETVELLEPLVPINMLVNKPYDSVIFAFGKKGVLQGFTGNE